ncbi:MAG TPA: site-specific integrase [Flavisolibacter sp.]|jgi:integrase|nr:site-specific integrase [Flavisolibacter sp.]
MGTIRFQLRTDKIDKQGKSPVRLIYQLHGQRKYYETGKKLFSRQWDSDAQKALYLDKKAAKKLLAEVDYALLLSEKEVQEFNRELQDLVRDIENIEKRFELDKVTYSVEMVLQKLNEQQTPTTQKDSPSKFLFDFIDRYISEHKETREAGSLTVYKSLRTHLQDYQRHTRKKVSFEKITYEFFQSFQNFLITGAGTTINRKGEEMPRTPLNNTTVAKQLSTVKTFLNYARKHGVKVPDSYRDFTIKREKLEVIALTNEEFETLYYFDLNGNKRLEQVRDVFCFACTTGLRYSDLNQLRREHIKEDEIRLTVKKTKEHLSIPLTPYSKAILAKYEEMHRPLPIISNQKMNAYIKELCEKAGINEPVEIVRFSGAKRIATTYPKYELIGVHTGRKTFATLSLERGMSAEEVMTITGHKDYQSFKRYVKVTEQRKKVVMLKAWGEAPSEVKLKRVI